MSWRRGLIYWLCFLVLGAYYVLALRRPQAGGDTRAAAARNVSVGDVIAVEVTRGPVRARFERGGGRWELREPPGRAVPADLVDALLEALADLSTAPVVAVAPVDPAQFGLTLDGVHLTLVPGTGEPIAVRLGGRNPAGTAVYALRDGSDAVILLGLDVASYADLVFEALR